MKAEEHAHAHKCAARIFRCVQWCGAEIDRTSIRSKRAGVRSGRAQPLPASIRDATAFSLHFMSHGGRTPSDLAVLFDFGCACEQTLTILLDLLQLLKIGSNCNRAAQILSEGRQRSLLLVGQWRAILSAGISSTDSCSRAVCTFNNGRGWRRTGSR